jgi:hypothetical protein
MKPTLKAPKSKLLKLENEKVLSNYAFEFNLRRYNKGAPGSSSETSAAATMRQEELQASLAGAHERQGLTLVHFSAQPELFLTKHILKHPLMHPATC